MGASRAAARAHDLHAKIDAVGFGFLIPLFFLSGGMMLGVTSIFSGADGLVGRAGAPTCHRCHLRDRRP